MSFDLAKPYRTRGLHEASATRGPDDRLYGWREEGEGYAPCVWTAEGRHPRSEFDLVNVAETRTVKAWLWVYDDGTVEGKNNEWGRRSGERKPIAVLEINREFTIGEGLDPNAD